MDFEKLPDEAIAQYRRDGMLFLPALADAAMVAELDRWSRALQEADDRPGYVWKYSDEEARDRGQRLLNRIERFRPHHEGLRRFMEGDPIRSVLRQLLGEEAVLFKDKINYKLPGGSGFAAHQDVQAGWARYGPQHVTVLVSIDEATEESGCLEIARGSGREGLIGDEWRPLEGNALEDLAFEKFPTLPGDAVVFDSYVAHRSEPNRSSRSRRVLYLTYNAASQGDHYEKYFADKHASYPPDIEREAGREYRYRV